MLKFPVNMFFLNYEITPLSSIQYTSATVIESPLCIYLTGGIVVVGNMASQCSLATLFPIQSQLDLDLEEAPTAQEEETLVLQYLKDLDERGDLKIPDFHTGWTF